jgi:hypothetical protein
MGTKPFPASFGSNQVHSDPFVAANIVDLWRRFAQTGDPNGIMKGPGLNIPGMKTNIQVLTINRP